MTRTLLIAFFFLLTNAVKAQQDTSTFYYKFSGRYVTEADSADFVRIITKDTVDRTLWKVQDFYRNGSLLRMAQCSDEWGNKFVKQAIEFYPNGRRKRILNYNDGRKEGHVYEYYPNGKLYTVVKYQKDKVVELKQCKDSTGVELAKDGRGKWIIYDAEFDKLMRSGSVMDGSEEGEWVREINANERSVFNYKKGKLVSGTYYDGKGKKTPFKEIDIFPEYKGGSEEFYQFTKRNFIYPATARSANITGIIRVTFVVERDGVLTDIKTVGDRIGYGLEEEAISMVKKTSPWNPGFQGGVPVRIQYTVPIKFGLVNSKGGTSRFSSGEY